jgi:hypothetical protein
LTGHTPPPETEIPACYNLASTGIAIQAQKRLILKSSFASTYCRAPVGAWQIGLMRAFEAGLIFDFRIGSNSGPGHDIAEMALMTRFGLRLAGVI